VNSFFFGYAISETDHDGNNPYRSYPRPFIQDLEAYVAWLRELVQLKRSQGCVALKIPIAYDRGLDFEAVSHARASQAFETITRRFASIESPAEANPAANDGGNLPSNAPSTGTSRAAEVGIASQDERFSGLPVLPGCRMAAELGCRSRSTPAPPGKRTTPYACWKPSEEPDTQFVLLHCSYRGSRMPATWSAASQRPRRPEHAAAVFFPGGENDADELIEGANSHQVAWGCDTWTPEESYGSLLALRHVLARTLSERIAGGYLDKEAAAFFIDNILYHNPQRLYRLEPQPGARQGGE
jgi:hypothetical protein